MRAWTRTGHSRARPARRLVAAPDADAGPERVVIDSRDAGPGALFVGLPGATEDGGRFAAQALAAGAWGVLTSPRTRTRAVAAAPAWCWRPTTRLRRCSAWPPPGAASSARP